MVRALANFGVVAMALVLCAGCAGAQSPEAQNPSLSFNHALGEGKRDENAKPTASKRPAKQTSEARARAERRKRSEPPDPEPLRLDAQWEYRLAYDAGEVRVASVRKRRFEQPVVTARRYGRFAIELWIGRELIDRVRFDFPLVQPDAHSEHQGSGQSPISLSAGAHSEQTVLVPASPRATRAVLVDNEGGEVSALMWPPDRPMGPDAERD